MDVISNYKLDILEKLLGFIGVSINNIPTTVPAAIFDDDSLLTKFKEYVPAAKKFYSSDKLTSLHANAFSKQKNPGLNLIRQILKENGFEIRSRLDRTTCEKQYIIRKSKPSVPAPAPVSVPAQKQKIMQPKIIQRDAKLLDLTVSINTII